MNYIQQFKRAIPRALWPYLGALRRRVQARPAKTKREKTRLLHDESLSESERDLLGKVSSRVYYHDGMYAGDGVYFKVGLSAISCLNEALRHARSSDPLTILDLPCGGGRVLRFLSQRFPAAKITACDLQHDLVDFCAAEFGAAAAYSEADFTRLLLDAQFDLIWCGSLITHLNTKGINSLLEFFVRHLTPGGLVVFTTHGNHAMQRMLAQVFDYGVSTDSVAEVVAAFCENGFGFASYPHESDYGVRSNEGQYGISLTSREWIGAIAGPLGLSEIYFAPQGWDDHQDVYGFLKQQ